ncbi:MAG TPA: dienelactone hydrolase family protein [Ferruginibacter sp.]|nr:dienelactone hydrolase family protein [Ferruginibacter sp.]
MKSLRSAFAVLFSTLLLFSCNNSKEKKAEEAKVPKLKEENITYKIDSLTMDGYIVYDENITGKRPAVLVVHEWWGLNDYAKSRAKQLAEMGYIAMAIDMYGNGRRADNPKDAEALAMPFYEKPAMAKTHFDAALNKFRSYAQVDTTNMAAIGYCFGGGVLLNLTRMGEPLKGIASFHGTMPFIPANKNLLKTQTLVCNGENDTAFVPVASIALFKKQMDSIGASYSFKNYANATHAFSNPAATALGQKFNLPIAYNAAADSASWNDMKLFFKALFK